MSVVSLSTSVKIAATNRQIQKNTLHYLIYRNLIVV